MDLEVEVGEAVLSKVQLGDFVLESLETSGLPVVQVRREVGEATLMIRLNEGGSLTVARCDEQSLLTMIIKAQWKMRVSSSMRVNKSQR